MKDEDCTGLLVRYREVCRMIWNLGFWPDPELHDHHAIALYNEAIARLFEAMVVLPLGRQSRLEDMYRAGELIDFRVRANRPGTHWLVSQSRPEAREGYRWEDCSMLRLESGSHEFRFLSYFDWDQQAPRDFRSLRVLVLRLDGRPDWVGRHALLDAAECSVWLAESWDEER